MDAQEMMDEIILKSLKGAYDNLVCFPYGEEETKMSKALKKVIKLYSTPSQYKEWKDSL